MAAMSDSRWEAAMAGTKANLSASSSQFDIRPLAGALGAEVYGVDLAAADPDTWHAIRAALAKYILLAFPGQSLAPEVLVQVGQNFGTVGFYPFAVGLADEPAIFPIVKEPHETRNFGEGWHSDTTYAACPPNATGLYAIDIPPAGGDTLFANMHAAYEALSDGMKAMLSPLRAVNSSTKRKTSGRRDDNSALGDMQKLRDDRVLVASHPVVRTHPVTGRKALYINALHTVCFEGWRESESRDLLAFLYEHATQPEFTCRYRWHAGTFAIWDNRSAQHLAVNDYHGYRREMHRLTIEGDQPG